MDKLYIACFVILLLSVFTAAEELKPQLITTENNDYFGYMKEFNGFKCQAKGTNLKYSWTHNDFVINADYILKYPEFNASTLQPIVRNIDASYQGDYQCFVKNSIGTIFGRKASVIFTIVGDFKIDKNEVRTETGELGKPFVLHCPEHFKSQKVKYSWKYIEADSRWLLQPNTNYFVANNGSLYFSTLRQTDVDFINNHGGIFCDQMAEPKGAASTSKQSHRIKLTATGNEVNPASYKPQIKTILSDYTIDYDSQQLVLKCGAIGHPIPTLKWYRVDSVTNSDREIVTGPGSDFKLSSHNQVLTITNVGGNKAGMYKCVATNSEGSDDASGAVKVAELPTWMTGGELQDLEPALYSRLEWECGAFGGVTYHWYKNGVLISDVSPDGKVVVQSRNSKSYLVIKNVTTANNGMYQCTAANELDTIYSTGRLLILERAPEFTEEMGPVTLVENRTGVIVCPVVASPPPQITWRKNGRIILKVGKTDSQNNDRFKVDENQKDLKIPHVQLSDEGEYTCEAENSKGKVRDSSIVSVGKDIKWVSAPVDNRNVTITLRFELDCEAEGDPSYEVSYRWLLNGLPLEYNARIHWVKEAHRLVILDSIVSDTGTYTCIASAETPLPIERRKDVDIVVKAPANPPDLVWVDGSCWDQTASLAWKVGATNNEEIYEYWIDWSTTYDKTEWTRLPKVLEEDAKPVRLNFNLLPPFSQISFRVTVFNRIGEGEPSVPTDPSDCITKPAAPRFSPREIKGVPGGANTLKLEWTRVPETFWGGPLFNYSVQWRRKVPSQQDESRWNNLPFSQSIRIFDGNNNSLTVSNPGYFVEWEFRIRSNNAYGSAPSWTYGTSYSGQDAPSGQPGGLSPDRVTARSADISWQRVTAPKNGTIFGYKIQYWHSGIGMDVAYDKNANITIDLDAINELEESREKRSVSKRSITKRDVRKSAHGLSKRDTGKQNAALTKGDLKTSIVSRYLANVERRLNKRDAQNAPRIRTKREDEDEDVEGEEPLDLCFNPDEPCYQDASDKELQLQELTPYKTYHVRIAAYNSGGLGPWSDELVFDTEEAPPGPPYSVNTYAYDKFCKLTWKEPRHKNGKILEYQVYGRNIVRRTLPWWMRRHIIYELNVNSIYEAKIRARTSKGWGTPVFRWFKTHKIAERPAQPLIPEVVGYGEDGVNVTFMEPLPTSERKYGGAEDMDEDLWLYRPVGGYDNEHRGTGGYPASFYVVYRRKYTNDPLKKTAMKSMWGPRDQTWIVIEKLEKDTVYEFATVPVNELGKGPQSKWADGLTGGIVPRVEKLYWYQRDWFIALIVVLLAACFLFLILVFATGHLKTIYYEGAPKRRKDRERERIYEPEDVDGGFGEFTLKSARSSRSVVTSRSEPPPAYHSVVGSASRHSGDFDEDEDVTDSDDEKHEVSTYYSDEKKVPLDDLDDDDEEYTKLATFV